MPIFIFFRHSVTLVFDQKPGGDFVYTQKVQSNVAPKKNMNFTKHYNFKEK